MGKFAWGGMGNDNVTIEENNRRQINIIGIREMFARLATQLVNEGKSDKAREVLKKCLEITPPDQVYYDQTMLPFVEAMYKAGMTDEAVEISKKVVDEYDGLLQYYLALKNDGITESRESKLGVGIIGQLAQYAVINKQDELGELFWRLYEKYSQLF